MREVIYQGCQGVYIPKFCVICDLSFPGQMTNTVPTWTIPGYRSHARTAVVSGDFPYLYFCLHHAAAAAIIDGIAGRAHVAVRLNILALSPVVHLLAAVLGLTTTHLLLISTAAHLVLILPTTVHLLLVGAATHGLLVRHDVVGSFGSSKALEARRLLFVREVICQGCQGLIYTFRHLSFVVVNQGQMTKYYVFLK